MTLIFLNGVLFPFYNPLLPIPNKTFFCLVGYLFSPSDKDVTQVLKTSLPSILFLLLIGLLFLFIPSSTTNIEFLPIFLFLVIDGLFNHDLISCLVKKRFSCC